MCPTSFQYVRFFIFFFVLCFILTFYKTWTRSGRKSLLYTRDYGSNDVNFIFFFSMLVRLQLIWVFTVMCSFGGFLSSTFCLNSGFVFLLQVQGCSTLGRDHRILLSALVKQLGEESKLNLVVCKYIFTEKIKVSS